MKPWRYRKAEQPVGSGWRPVYRLTESSVEVDVRPWLVPFFRIGEWLWDLPMRLRRLGR